MKSVVQQDWNILIGNQVLKSDRELFFGPLNEAEQFLEMPDDTTMPDILALTGIFPSKSQARKNGWGENRIATFIRNERKGFDLPWHCGMIVPHGFTDFRGGKGKVTRITILKIT